MLANLIAAIPKPSRLAPVPRRIRRRAKFMSNLPGRVEQPSGEWVPSDHKKTTWISNGFAQGSIPQLASKPVNYGPWIRRGEKNLGASCGRNHGQASNLTASSLRSASCLGNIDEQSNGLLINWYDGRKEHYIGKHRDRRTNVVVDSPIVTLSIGQERIFRLWPWPGSGVMG